MAGKAFHALVFRRSCGLYARQTGIEGGAGGTLLHRDEHLAGLAAGIMAHHAARVTEWSADHRLPPMRAVLPYCERNAAVLAALTATCLAAYGFELFSLNLTIDEELHAFSNGPHSMWIAEGRWGMYLVNAILLPCTLVPVIPLLVALVLHAAAALLALDCWRVRSPVDTIALGGLMLTLPTLSHLYMFSTVSHGIGCGLLCAATSLCLFQRGRGWWRWCAVVPAAFAIAIYQPLALVVATLFTVHLAIENDRGRGVLLEGVRVAGLLVVSFLLTILVQKTLTSLLAASLSDADKAVFAERAAYIGKHFDLESLRSSPREIAAMVLRSMLQYYSGWHDNYGLPIAALGGVVTVSLAVSCRRIWGREETRRHRLVAVVLLACLLGLPFAGGMLSKGVLQTRTLLALPFAVAGLVLLALRHARGIVRTFLLVLVAACVFQSCVSTNRLFGTAHLSLEADRLVAVRVMERIDQAAAAAGEPPPVHLEVVGRLRRNESTALPRRVAFGRSFFELRQTGPRVAAFLEICGYRHLEPPPASQVAELASVAREMPAWPAPGSVKVVGDTALVKFSD